jgi:hypothetical protein
MKYGPNTKTVEAFTRHLKGMTPEQWRVVLVARNAAWDAAADAPWHEARDAAWDAAWETALEAADDAEWDAAVTLDAAMDAKHAALDAAYAVRDVAWDAASDAALSATHEILGATLMRHHDKPFFFLPMFGFADPEAVLAADQAN